MSHGGGQAITVKATKHYPYFTHMPFATHHKILKHLPLSEPFRNSKTNQHMEKPKGVDLLCLGTCLLWKVGEGSKCKKKEKKKGSILKTMTAMKKLRLQRDGLGQLPIHRVCAFAIACLNQYVSNSPWNTISPCLKKKMKNTQRED